MTESEKCLVCGRPAIASVRLKSRRTGSLMVVHFCARHEKERAAGKRRSQKVMNKRIREMFK